MTFDRAYSPVQKFEKRQEILISAEDLFAKQKGEFPTVSAICTYSSIAKGTVYLYFKSKEEIYLALLTDYFSQWMEPNNISSIPSNIDSVIELILSFIEKNPIKYQLINRRHFLETNCQIDKTVEFQKNLYQTFDIFSNNVASHLGEDLPRVRQWLHDVYFYLQGLWRTANPSDEVKEVLNQSDMKDFFLPDFKDNSKRVMKILWQATN